MEKHFAALSLPDPASDSKISRAISFSELPSTRRILIEQSYQTDDSGTLVKQYSCEQIFDKLSNSREVRVSEVLRSGSERCLSNTWRTTIPVFGSLGKAGWHDGHFGQVTKSIQSSNSDKMESMEIEEIDAKPFATKKFKNPTKKLPIVELNGMTLSDTNHRDRTLIKASTFQSLQTGEGNVFAKPIVRSRSASPKKTNERTNFADDSVQNTNSKKTNKVPICNYNETKKKLRSLIPKDDTDLRGSRVSCTCYKFIFYFLLSISAATLAIFLYPEDTTVRKSLEYLNFGNMSMELRKRVHGQDKAIEKLIKELERNSEGTKLIVLIGGTGVGKSHTIGIIAKYFVSYNDVLQFSAPMKQTFHKGAIDHSHGKCALTILENLRKTDLNDVVRFVNLMNDQTKELCVYAIAALNPQEKENSLLRKIDLQKSADEISTFFQNKELRDTTIIVFENLDEKSLDACINQAADEKNIILSHEELIEIRENLIFTGSGCKGAYAKVQLVVDS